MIKTISRFPGSLIVWITSYVFFLLTLADNLSAAHDSIHYLNGIVKGKELFHQHHLLYQFLAYKWFNVWSAVFPGVSDVYIVESFTAIWGSSSLVVIWLFYRNRFGLTQLHAALGTAVIAFSYGFWFYSVNVEVYAPPLFFILTCLYVLTGTTNTSVWKIAALHSLAILFHQVNILFAVVVLYVLYTRLDKTVLLKSVLQYAFTGLIITGGTYFFIGWFIEGHDSVFAWIQWMEGYTVGHGYWQGLSWKTPLHVITGFSHAFLGGHYIFQLPAMEYYLQESFISHGLTDEIFLSSKVSPSVAITLFIITIIFAALFLVITFRFFVKFRAMKMHYQVIKPMLICLVVYSLFFCFWMPEILEFWILQMVLVWMLLIGMLPVARFPFSVSLRNGLIVLIALIFTINYFGSIRWLQNKNNDWYYNEIKNVKDSFKKDDLIIVEQEWIMKDFMRYYTSAMVIATDEPGYNEADASKKVKEKIAAGDKVYLYRGGLVGNDQVPQDSGGRGIFIQSY